MYDAATRALYLDLFKSAEAQLKPKLADVIKKAFEIQMIKEREEKK